MNDPPIAPPGEPGNELEDRKGGFPHSEISGSKGASASPELIAACHVLLRLSAPRHPSEALQRLIVLSKTHARGRNRRRERVLQRYPRTDFTLSDYVFIESTLEATFRPGKSFLLRCQCAPPFKGHANLDDREPLVEPDGIEPTTSCLQSTRSTN